MQRSVIVAVALLLVAGCAQARKLSQDLEAVSGQLAPADLGAAPSPAPAAVFPDDIDAPVFPGEEGGDSGRTVAAAAAANPTYTLAEVATHNTPEDAWFVVEGKVYDVTAWAPMHPGGASRITDLAGTDATATFVGQHGIPSVQYTMLEAYFVGDLAA